MSALLHPEFIQKIRKKMKNSFSEVTEKGEKMTTQKGISEIEQKRKTVTFFFYRPALKIRSDVFAVTQIHRFFSPSFTHIPREWGL